MCLSAVTIKSSLIFDVSSTQKTPDTPQASAASASTRSVVVNEQMVEMAITGKVPREILDPECTPMADPLPSAEDAELAKRNAAELFKVTHFLTLIPSPHSFLLCADHRRLSASDGGGRRCSTLMHICQPIGAIFAFGLSWTGIKIWYSETWLCLLTKIVLSALLVFHISYISLTKTLINVGPHALLAGLVGWPLLLRVEFEYTLCCRLDRAVHPNDSCPFGKNGTARNGLVLQEQSVRDCQDSAAIFSRGKVLKDGVPLADIMLST